MPVRYTNQIEINLPREEVVELFDDTENMYHWQTGLKSHEHLSGEPGKEGAKMKLTYELKKGKLLELTETITKNNLPYTFHGTYAWKEGYNTMHNSFEKVGRDKTLWVAEIEYHFSGFLKLMGPLLKGAFRKQSQTFMDQFKVFAEDHRKSQA